jgi:hypothetical protein
MCAVICWYGHRGGMFPGYLQLVFWVVVWVVNTSIISANMVNFLKCHNHTVDPYFHAVMRLNWWLNIQMNNDKWNEAESHFNWRNDSLLFSQNLSCMTLKKQLKNTQTRRERHRFLTGDGKNNISVNEWRKSCSNVCKFLHLWQRHWQWAGSSSKPLSSGRAEMCSDREGPTQCWHCR